MRSFTYICGLILTLTSLHSIADNSIIKPVTVISSINKNKFFDVEITKFEFDRPELLLMFDQSKQTFRDENLRLIVETTVPEDNTDIHLAIRMSQNWSNCYNEPFGSENAVPIAGYDQIASLTFIDSAMDGSTEINLDESLPFDFNDNIDGFKAAQYDTRVSFQTPISSEVQFCQGGITMTLEFAL